MDPFDGDLLDLHIRIKKYKGPILSHDTIYDLGKQKDISNDAPQWPLGDKNHQ